MGYVDYDEEDNQVMNDYSHGYLRYDNRYLSCLNDIIRFHELTLKAYERIDEMIEEIVMNIGEIRYRWGIR
jgi:hypothetical protein